MTNLMVALVIVLIVGLSAYKVYSEKRKGAKCVGCASSKTCSSNKK